MSNLITQNVIIAGTALLGGPECLMIGAIGSLTGAVAGGIFGAFLGYSLGSHAGEKMRAFVAKSKSEYKDLPKDLGKICSIFAAASFALAGIMPGAKIGIILSVLL